MPDLTGQTLKGRYRVESLLGRGGMAEVYKAWDTWRNYHVAIKVMREDLAEDLEFLRRFRREATALARLAHENIVRFYAFEQDDLTAFIVMDYVEGTTLRAEIARADGPLPPERVLSIARQVCAALNYAHLEGVIHRDIKPGNIMLRPDGRVLLSDFGISKAIDAATATATTVSVGTPAYMSPEQCCGQSPDVRTDVYSLGVVVYEMLAGRRPFVGDLAPETITNTTERIRWEQMHAAAPALRKLNPAVSREVEEVVSRALAKNREARWPTVAAFGEALGRGFGQRIEADKRMGGAAAGGQVGEQGGRGAGEQGREAAKAKVMPLLPSAVRPAAAQEPRPAARSFGLRDVPWPIWAVGGGLVVVLLVLAVAWTSSKGGNHVTPTAPVVAQAVATSLPSPTQTRAPANVPSPMTTSTLVPTHTPSTTPTETSTRAPTFTSTLTATATPTRTPTATSTRPAPSLPVWIRIPGDDFVMGSSEADLQKTLVECNATEGAETGTLCERNWFNEPQQAVHVDDFEITKHEITNAQYNACVAASVCTKAGRTPADKDIRYDPGYFADNFPVMAINWFDADVFCRWVGGRLPTEVEWERAARGSDARRYPWGNTYDPSRANLDSSYPTAVGSYPGGASPYGVLDMAGNVFEWTATQMNGRYVVRGGGWTKYYFRGRVTDRGTLLDPAFANYDVGFRCVHST